MKTLWNYIDGKNHKAVTKFHLVYLIIGPLAMLMGLALWAAVRTQGLSGADWMLCFMGYPAAAAWFTLLLYSFRHPFHDGRPRH